MCVDELENKFAEHIPYAIGGVEAPSRVGELWMSGSILRLDVKVSITRRGCHEL